jgi:hypothetical protein
VPEQWDSSLLTRRSVLLVAGAGLAAATRLYGSASDFWNKKPPEQWSADDIQRLITKSPWAKEVTAQSGQSGRFGGLSGPRIGGMGGPRIGGMGGPGMGRGRGGRGPEGPGSAPASKGTIRWESAKPVLEALKTSLPDAFAGHYVISVNGFPLHDRRQRDEEQEDMLERLKAFTTLEPKGKRAAQPGVVQQQQAIAGGASLLFGFSKELLALDRDDKEVTFSTRLGPLALKTKFELKDMVYRGALAL